MKLKALILLCLFAVTAAYADIAVSVIPSLAPNAYGSASWGTYASNAVYAIEHNLSAYGDPTKPTYYLADSSIAVNQGLVTSFHSWMGSADPGAVFGADFANEYGNRMHFGLHIVATGGAMFNIEQLSFAELGSDPSTGLTYSWAAGSLTAYSSLRVGLIHNPDGSVTRVESGTGSQLVDEFIYVGSGDAYWPAGDLVDPACTGCSTAEKQAFIDDVAAALGAYTFTGTYALRGVTGGPIASGSGTFDLTPVPEPSAIALLGSVLGILGFGLRRRNLRRGK